MSATETLHQYLEQQRVLVDDELERMLPAAHEYPASIHHAMRYAVFAGGKRLRPTLCLEAGLLFGGDPASLLRLAGAIEIIHTYSLIHDDLPALDNDDLRRGKPTCHRVFGEATAILAGDALLTLAYETISRSEGAVQAARRLRTIHELSHAIGTRAGMVGGQVVDLETTGHAVELVTLHYIHSAKTAALIAAAVRCGGLDANAPEPDLGRLTTYGEKVGLAFQIADDLLDVLGSREMAGKAVGKDGARRKATYPALHGVEASQRIAASLTDEACEVLAPYGSRAERLREIARFLIARNS